MRGILTAVVTCALATLLVLWAAGLLGDTGAPPWASQRPASPGPKSEPDGPGPLRLRGAADARSSTTEEVLTGSVISGADGQPIRGAAVGYVLAPAVGRVPSVGSVVWYSDPAEGERGVAVGPDASWQATLKRQDLIEATATDAAGTFRLPWREDRGLLGAIDDAHLACVEAVHGHRQEVVILLRPGWRASGTVSPPPEDVLPPDYVFGLVGLGAAEAWTTRLGSGGRFDVVLHGDACIPVSLDARWQFEAPVSPLRPGDRAVHLRLERAACVRVVDAETAKPIDAFRLVVRDPKGHLLQAREVRDPAGVAGVLDGMPGRAALERVGQVTVWAEGYAAWTADAAAFHASMHQEARLVAGRGAHLLGTVRLLDAPLAGASVTLHAIDDGWNPARPATDWPEVASTSTNPAGQFALTGREGTMLLMVRHGRRTHNRLVTMPAVEAVNVDLGGRTVLHVRVVDFQPGRDWPPTILLRDRVGAVRRQKTSASGRTRFEDVASGDYEIGAYSEAEAYRSSSSLQNWTRITVQEEGAQYVEIEGPFLKSPMPGGQRLLAVRVEGEPDLEGWEARDKYDNDLGWQPLDVDPTLLLKRVLEVRSPSGQRWVICPAPDQFERGGVEIRTDRACYTGTVVEDQDGKPRRDGMIWASEAGASPLLLVGVPLSEHGEFRITGLRGGVHDLTFSTPDGERIRGLSFRPRTEPTEAGVSLVIRVRRRDGDHWVGHRTVSVSGVVRREGAPLRGDPSTGDALIDVQARFEQADGHLLLGARRGGGLIGEDGRYGLDVVVADDYVVTVWEHASDPARKVRHVLHRTSVEELRALHLD